MPEPLLSEDRQRGGDAVQNALEIDVDHLFPILDTELVEQRNGPDAGIADENVELAEPLACQPDEIGEVDAPFDVRQPVGGLSARFFDMLCE